MLLFIFSLKLTLDNFFQNECWYFCSKLIVDIYCFKLSVDISLQNNSYTMFLFTKFSLICSKYLSKFLFKLTILFHLIVQKFIWIDCSYICSNWLFVFLIKMFFEYIFSNWLLAFLFKIFVDFSVQTNCWHFSSL